MGELLKGLKRSGKRDKSQRSNSERSDLCAAKIFTSAREELVVGSQR